MMISCYMFCISQLLQLKKEEKQGTEEQLLWGSIKYMSNNISSGNDPTIMVE